MIFFFFFFLFFLNLLFLFKKMNMFIMISLISNLNLTIDFEINMMNMIFSLTVLLISISIILYMKFYFHFNFPLIFKLNFSIFVLSMILLIFSNSFVPIMIGWDGLGISSFYLISFYSSKDSIYSSLFTFFFNRLGDSFLLVFFMLLLINYSSINLMKLNLFLVMLFFLSMITKSCQIPFGIWLPLAMAAPTPISSLVHSSTLVTAGVYLMIKMNFLFFLKEFSLIVSFFGLITFFSGGLFALINSDFKKSIAFSTLSQLGFIMFSLSIGNFMISFIHLLFHAFFKSSLFMNLGLLMSFNYSIQDIRLMNNKSKNLFFIFMFMFFCFNLMGMISFSGFLSKDLILIFFFNNSFKMFILMMFYFSCILTSCYSMKFMINLLFSFKSLNIYMVKKMNFYFFPKMISFFLLLLIPLMFMDILLMESSLLISKNFKLLFFSIYIFSIVLVKMTFSLMEVFLKFSFLFMLIESFMYYLNKFFSSMKKIMNFMLFLDFNQVFFFNYFISFNLNFLLMKVLFFMNINIMILFLLFILMKKHPAFSFMI